MTINSFQRSNYVPLISPVPLQAPTITPITSTALTTTISTAAAVTTVAKVVISSTGDTKQAHAQAKEVDKKMLQEFFTAANLYQNDKLTKLITENNALLLEPFAGYNHGTVIHMACLGRDHVQLSFFLSLSTLPSAQVVNTRDALGRTPLMIALYNDIPSAQLVQTLLNAGADPYAVDKQGNSGLHFMALRGFMFSHDHLSCLDHVITSASPRFNAQVLQLLKDWDTNPFPFELSRIVVSYLSLFCPDLVNMPNANNMTPWLEASLKTSNSKYKKSLELHHATAINRFFEAGATVPKVTTLQFPERRTTGNTEFLIEQYGSDHTVRVVRSHIYPNRNPRESKTGLVKHHKVKLIAH